MDAAVPAMPKNPKNPAMMAMIRKVTAQLSMLMLLSEKRTVSPASAMKMGGTEFAKTDAESVCGEKGRGVKKSLGVGWSDRATISRPLQLNIVREPWNTNAFL